MVHVHEFALHHADFTEHRGYELPFILNFQIAFYQHFLHVLNALFFPYNVCGLIPVSQFENQKKDRMKGPEGNPAASCLCNLFIALLHFPGRCPGKCDYQNMGGIHACFFRKITDPVGDDCRLARTGSCQNQHRTFPVPDCRFLCVVKCHLLDSYASSICIPLRILARDSSLPRTSMISVAPAGVICLPETAVRMGHITKPVLTPVSSTYFERTP